MKWVSFPLCSDHRTHGIVISAPLLTGPSSLPYNRARVLVAQSARLASKCIRCMPMFVTSSLSNPVHASSMWSYRYGDSYLSAGFLARWPALVPQFMTSRRCWHSTRAFFLTLGAPWFALEGGSDLYAGPHLPQLPPLVDVARFNGKAQCYDTTFTVIGCPASSWYRQLYMWENILYVYYCK